MERQDESLDELPDEGENAEGQDDHLDLATEMKIELERVVQAKARPAGVAFSPNTDSGRSETATNNRPIRAPLAAPEAAKYPLKVAGTTEVSLSRHRGASRR
jgi:hypothetical protein